MKNLIILGIILHLSCASWAQPGPGAMPGLQLNTAMEDTLGRALVDFRKFVLMTSEVDSFRSERLVTFDSFLSMAKDSGTIILDTRSQMAYDGKHIKGAIHLNFSDFTAEKLHKLIPDSTTRILIYCNNNIGFDPAWFASKSQPLALNIPTFINLYGYGYKNIYELSDLVPVDHPDLVFEGTAVIDEESETSEY